MEPDQERAKKLVDWFFRKIQRDCIAVSTNILQNIRKRNSILTDLESYKKRSQGPHVQKRLFAEYQNLLKDADELLALYEDPAKGIQSTYNKILEKTGYDPINQETSFSYDVDFNKLNDILTDLVGEMRVKIRVEQDVLQDIDTWQEEDFVSKHKELDDLFLTHQEDTLNAIDVLRESTSDLFTNIESMKNVFGIPTFWVGSAVVIFSGLSFGTYWAKWHEGLSTFLENSGSEDPIKGSLIFGGVCSLMFGMMVAVFLVFLADRLLAQKNMRVYIECIPASPSS